MENIIFSDKETSDNIIKNIINDGVDNLHILSDFDRTLTKAFSNGKKRTSLISVLRAEGYLSEDYREKAYELFDYYNPIEIDPNISNEIKIKEMTTWWHKHLELLVNSGLSKYDIKNVSCSGLIEFRDGTEKLLSFLNNYNIPILIISANGLGTDSINLYLESKKSLYDNINVISNSFKWDNNGKSIGYDKRVIHTFNKGETVLEEFPNIYNKIKDRKNVILLGDSLGDPNMIDGFKYKNLLKIGFLNDNEEELLEKYKEIYDIIITGDGSIEELNKILNSF